MYTEGGHDVEHPSPRYKKKLRPVETELLHEGERRDMTKLTGVFRGTTHAREKHTETGEY